MTFYQRLQGSFTCHWDPMTWDRHYSDHPSHYVSPRPGIEPGLTVCKASMLPTTPPGGIFLSENQLTNVFLAAFTTAHARLRLYEILNQLGESSLL